MCGLLLGRRNSCEELSALEFVQMEVSANDISEYEILDCRNFRTKNIRYNQDFSHRVS